MQKHDKIKLRLKLVQKHSNYEIKHHHKLNTFSISKGINDISFQMLVVLVLMHVPKEPMLHIIDLTLF